MPTPSTDKPRDLAKLYPTPKTYEQLAQDREDIRRLHASRKPKHILVSTCLKLYSILVGILLLTNTLPLLLRFGAIAGVFLGFLFGLILFAYILWILKSVSTAFEKHTLNAAPLFILYAASYTPLAFILYKATSHLQAVVWITLLTLLHGAVVSFIFRFIVKHTQDS